MIKIPTEGSKRNKSQFIKGPFCLENQPDTAELDCGNGVHAISAVSFVAAVEYSCQF